MQGQPSNFCIMDSTPPPTGKLVFTAGPPMTPPPSNAGTVITSGCNVTPPPTGNPVFTAGPPMTPPPTFRLIYRGTQLSNYGKVKMGVKVPPIPNMYWSPIPDDGPSLSPTSWMEVTPGMFLRVAPADES